MPSDISATKHLKNDRWETPSQAGHVELDGYCPRATTKLFSGFLDVQGRGRVSRFL